MILNSSHLDHIERDLSDYLRPVDPDPKFVDTLSRRLTRSDRTILGRPVTSQKYLPFLGLGLMVVVVVLLLLDDRDKR